MKFAGVQVVLLTQCVGINCIIHSAHTKCKLIMKCNYTKLRGTIFITTPVMTYLHF